MLPFKDHKSANIIHRQLGDADISLVYTSHKIKDKIKGREEREVITWESTRCFFFVTHWLHQWITWKNIRNQQSETNAESNTIWTQMTLCYASTRTTNLISLHKIESGWAFNSQIWCHLWLIMLLGWNNNVPPGKKRIVKTWTESKSSLFYLQGNLYFLVSCI